ncbi:MAG: amidohydrolase family protein [Phycicoccus sp.]|nr:amidohydrolase family protein [Phycicoccus sp.]NMM34178.1 amidohydrolase family protein [Phycicoccus sp.]
MGSESTSSESSRSTTSTLYRGGFVHTPVDSRATAMVVVNGQIAWIGSDEEATRHSEGVDAVVDLDGALVTPAFVDAHVHTSATGMALRSVELTDVRYVAEALARIEDAARKRQGRPVYAPNWDEDAWPEHRPLTAQELDRASYGGVVYSPRVDGHSAVISSALAAASGARNLPGWNESGLVTRDAHHAARDTFSDGVSPADRRADIDAALKAAAAAGIGLVHENAGPYLSSAEDLADVLAAGDRGDLPQVIGYWAELVADEAQARELAERHGVRGLAGDLNIDGSIGSRTASLRAPYADGDGPRDGDSTARCGNAYLTVEQVRDHVAACTLAGIQAGFHVIGDAGVDTVVEGMQAAAALIGSARVVAARHRLEHLEMVDAAGIGALVGLGVTASVQPAFDAFWGGSHGMYAARLGRDRVMGMNRFASMAAAGMSLAFGSDTPVTPFAPWGAVRAAVNHHEPAERISVETAFLAHTRGGWRVAGIDDRGFLDLGQPATFAVWSLGDDAATGITGLPDMSPGAPLPTNLRTVIRGRTVFDREGALS